jgi:hypothetical protein
MREREVRRQRGAGYGAALLVLCLAQGAQTRGQTGGPLLVVEYGSTGVTVVAKAVSLRRVVGEWARIGGVRVVNPEHIPEAPVTVELRDVPEAVAVDVLLRGLPGYFLQQRPPDAAGHSAFDRLVVAGTLALRSPAAAGAGRMPGTPGDDRSDGAETDLWSPPPGTAPAVGGAMGAPPDIPPAAPARAIQPSMPGQTRPGAAPATVPSKEPGGNPR